MVRKYLWLFLTIGGILPGNIGWPDIIVSVDMDPVANGIQSNVSGSIGSEIRAGLWLQLTGTTSISGYNFSVQYDTAELTFQSRTETPSVLTGLSELDFSNPTDSATGILRRFDGGTFNPAGGPSGPFSAVKIGEIVFLAKSPSGSVSDFDVTPGRFEASADRSFDNNFSEITTLITFNGGSFTPVAVVPEPTSMSLIGLTVLISAFRRRRR